MYAQKTIMKRLFHPVDTLFILLFFLIGCWTIHSFFRSGCNLNDFKTLGKPRMTAPSDFTMVIEGTLVNNSPVPIRAITMAGDAYDEGGRILGTGRFAPGHAVTINPSDTLSYTMQVPISGGYRAAKSIMLIPKCHLGTGRITIATWYLAP
jgi:hypothetical protein